MTVDAAHYLIEVLIEQTDENIALQTWVTPLAPLFILLLLRRRLRGSQVRGTVAAYMFLLWLEWLEVL